jgi:hypothetical protein
MSPAQFAAKLGITPQAILKKVHNTLEHRKAKEEGPVKNGLPDDFEIKEFGRFFILGVPSTYEFPAKGKKKKRAKGTPAE